MEASRYPLIDRIVHALGGTSEIRQVPIPLDCRDGFSEAYYGRPERLLEPGVRRAMSAWTFVDPAIVAQGMDRLRDDLDNGTWDAGHRLLRTHPNFDGALRLVSGNP